MKHAWTHDFRIAISIFHHNPIIGMGAWALNNYGKPIEYETYERKLSNPELCDMLIDPQADYQSDKIKWMCEPLYVTEKRRIN